MGEHNIQTEFTLIKRFVLLHFLGIPVPKDYGLAISNIVKYLDYSKKVDVDSVDNEVYTCYLDKNNNLKYYGRVDIYNKTDIIVDICFLEVCKGTMIENDFKNTIVRDAIAKMILKKLGVEFHYFGRDQLNFLKVRMLLSEKLKQ